MCLAIMPLQLCALLLQYLNLTGSSAWRAAAGAMSPHKIISIISAIVFEDEAVHLHWKQLDQLEPHLLARALVDNLSLLRSPCFYVCFVTCHHQAQDDTFARDLWYLSQVLQPIRSYILPAGR